MNYQIYNTYNQIRNDLEQSHLPIGTAYYILKDLLNDLEQGFRQAVAEESQNMASEQKDQVLKKVKLDNGNDKGGSES